MTGNRQFICKGILISRFGTCKDLFFFLNFLLWAMGWLVEQSGFDSRQGQEIVLRIFQTGSGAHPVSYAMGTGYSFPGGNAAGA